MSAPATELTATELAPALVACLEPLLPAATISGLGLLKGGYSREMWSFDAQSGSGARRSLILCADSAVGVVGSGDQALSRTREANLLHALHHAGLPVPDAICSGDVTSPLGREFLVMERGTGTATVGPLRRDPWYAERRDELATQLAGVLARIHAADVPAGVLGPRPDGAEVAPRELARWTAELAATPAAHTPVLDRAVAWLGAHLPPPPPRVSLAHGDFRTGNILHGHDEPGQPDGFRLVLDWEMAHWSDPLEDVAWTQLVCWRVGTGRVGALVDLHRWSELYATAAGHAVDADALHWWEVFGSVKMSFLIQRAAARTAQDEQALLLRLFAELDAELDVLVPAAGESS